MTATLTSGAIYNAYSNAGTTNKCPEAIVQVVVIKQMPSQPSGSATDRYKMVVSDGSTYITGIFILLNEKAMLASQLNPIAASGSLAKYSIVKLKQCWFLF